MRTQENRMGRLRPLLVGLGLAVQLAVVLAMQVRLPDYPDASTAVLRGATLAAVALLAWRWRRCDGQRLALGLLTGVLPYWLLAPDDEPTHLLAVLLAGVTLVAGPSHGRSTDLSTAAATRRAVVAGIGSFFLGVAGGVHLSLVPAMILVAAMTAPSLRSPHRAAIAWAAVVGGAVGLSVGLAPCPPRLFQPPEPWPSGIYGVLDAALGADTGLLVWLPLLTTTLLAGALHPARPAGRLLLAGFTGAALSAFLWPASLLPAPGFDASPGGPLAALLLALTLGVGPSLPPRTMAAGWGVAGLLGVLTTPGILAPAATSLSVLPATSTLPRRGAETEHAWGGERWRVPATGSVVVEPWGMQVVDGVPFDVLLGTPGFEADPLVLLSTPLPAVSLELDDWATHHRLDLVGGPRGTHQLVRLPTAPGWRYHPPPPPRGAIDRDRSWAWRRLRLSVPSAGPGGEVVLRPLGSGDVGPALAAEVVELALPTAMQAGSAHFVDVVLRNAGTLVWETKAPPSMILGSWFVPEPVGVRAAVDGPRAAVARRVAPGETLRQPLRLRLPEQPGRVWLSVDLAFAGVAWLEELRGEPLAAGWIELLPPGEAAPAAAAGR